MTPDEDRVQWMYLDMNSFFASVEQEMRPELRGRPIAVVPVQTDTTCCIAVSYEGKAFGIKTGTKVGDARKICPQMVFVEGDHRNYVHYHGKIIEAVQSCLPIEAVCSIDEIAFRLTGSHQSVAVATHIAQRIKHEIREKVGSTLRCSIGVAPNRYLAKIAADMQKPDGFTVIRKGDLPEILYSLQPRDLVGVGRQMERRLLEFGIYTLEQLLSKTAQELRQVWGGVRGEELWKLLRGEDLPSKKEEEQKTISHSQVLAPAHRNEQDALKILKKLTSKTAFRLRKEKLWAGRVQIFVRFLGRDSWAESLNVFETQDTLVFLNAVQKLWEQLPTGGSFLAVGVVLCRLVSEGRHVPSLFESAKRGNLIHTLDRLNERFGRDAVYFGATHEMREKTPLRIAFTRIPEEDEDLL